MCTHMPPPPTSSCPTCPPCLEAGQAHLVLQLLVLCGYGFTHSDEATHSHTDSLAHPLHGPEGLLRLLGLVLMIDQGGNLKDTRPPLSP